MRKTKAKTLLPRRRANVSAPPFNVEREFEVIRKRILKETPGFEHVVVGGCFHADGDHEKDSRVYAHTGHKTGGSRDQDFLLVGHFPLIFAALRCRQRR